MFDHLADWWADQSLTPEEREVVQLARRIGESVSTTDWYITTGHDSFLKPPVVHAYYHPSGQSYRVLTWEDWLQLRQVVEGSQN